MVLTNGETSNYVDVNTKVELVPLTRPIQTRKAGSRCRARLAQASLTARRPWYSFAKAIPTHASFATRSSRGH